MFGEPRTRRGLQMAATQTPSISIPLPASDSTQMVAERDGIDSSTTGAPLHPIVSPSANSTDRDSAYYSVESGSLRAFELMEEDNASESPEEKFSPIEK